MNSVFAKLALNFLLVFLRAYLVQSILEFPALYFSHYPSSPGISLKMQGIYAHRIYIYKIDQLCHTFVMLLLEYRELFQKQIIIF